MKDKKICLNLCIIFSDGKPPQKLSPNTKYKNLIKNNLNMKLNLILAMTTILLIATFPIACKKSNPLQNSDHPKEAPNYQASFPTLSENGISVKNNCLKFPSIDSYIELIDSVNDSVNFEYRQDLMDKFNDYSGFHSFHSKILNGGPFSGGSLTQNDSIANDSLNNDFFTSFLNEDLAVQIGDWIIKVNPLTDHVYAIYDEEGSYADLISENTGNPNLKVFSNEDFVLESLSSLENGGDGKNQGFFSCNEGGVGERHNKQSGYAYLYSLSTPPVLVDQRKSTWTADYNKWGIYFVLSGEQLVEQVNVSNGNTSKVNVDAANLQMWIKYKRRCQPERTLLFEDHPWANPFGTSKSWIIFKIYQGATPLNKLFLSTKGAIVWDNTPYWFTTWAHIEVGY